MPYTFAHIGYVLPMKKRWVDKLSFTGLVFGSITPDYDFLFRLTNISDHIFQYDLKCILFLIYPLAMVSAIFYHLLCRNIIIDNLPAFFRDKYTQSNSKEILQYFKGNFFRISFSIIIAIFLHLFLDFFGHINDPYLVKMYVLKHVSNNEMAGKAAFLMGCYALPVLFSLVGIYLIYVFELNRKFTLSMIYLSKQQLRFWLTLLSITIVLSILKYYYTDEGKMYLFDFLAIITTASFIISCYLTCFLYNLMKYCYLLMFQPSK